MTHRGPFQPLPFCDSVILQDGSIKLKKELKALGTGIRERNKTMKNQI